MHYLWLVIAIALETIGTMSLQASQQFTRLWPTVLCLTTYFASFYFMSLALKFMPVGVVYAIWSGLGIVLITGFSYLIFNQRLDTPAVLGLALIMVGIVVIQVFSDVTPH
ncbi:multidrug efflux SMR transporter [Loktanella sp. SALINAS62]|uniref:DMT family transporter n=1 Tax=Loktanella sp. SALINAS62 TaxID=2706124 RepID=UPI001B8D31BC|nr:multidrug efflux SMR transporter [Loktanella sp. SALINAS62]MBS1303736.1 multidrug efflux SMR transporter [Loktanella sp. SALINAS62]